MSTGLSARVVKVSEILGIPEEKILKALDDEGISNDAGGILVLDSPTTTIDDLVCILDNCAQNVKPLKLKAAAALLKDKDSSRVPDPVKEQEVSPKGAFEMQSVADALKSIRPIQQWNDQELLEKFTQDRDPEIEQELHKRSSGRNFIVLKGNNEPGKEDIDIENSLSLLKVARKRVTPSILPVGDTGAVYPVYPILSLNLHDRMVELCPFCGETLYKGYCEKCNTRFSGENTGIGDDTKAYIHLIARSGKFDANSFSDRKAVMASASKGLDDLRITWPSISQKFDELKMTGDLPKLRFISSRPTSVQDPFFMNGNRSVGNRSF